MNGNHSAGVRPSVGRRTAILGKGMKWIVGLLLTVAPLFATAQRNAPAVIPQVQSVKQQDASFVLSAESRWNLPKDAHLNRYLTEKLTALFGRAPQFVTSKGDVELKIVKDPSLGNEGYRLSVTDKGIRMEAHQPAGLFYGFQTLLQLLPPQALEKNTQNKPAQWTIGGMEIVDQPQFPWRGMMLDVSRHWFTKEEVKKFIDELATYKMNVFHWHLTDDQGWRMEVPALPKLTEKGAWRASRVGEWWQREPQQPGEATPYGGYYTEADMREVVAYAADRFVRVIPEIDVPGHSLAALVAYPEVACKKAADYINVGNKFYGIDENSLCVGKEVVYEFMDKVLTEVARIFPDDYIHIGGDECFKGFWKESPECQALMKKEKITDVNGLQSYFIKQMETLAKSKGKKLIGWDEINEGGLAPEATVMSWRGMEGGIAAAKAGHHVIMTPTDHCYLDLYQGEPSVEPNTYAMCRLSDSYRFNPVPDGVDKQFVLGSQGNLWSESVPTFHHAEYMSWPRGWALSEVLWSGSEKQSWPDFVSRVETHFQRADASGINYAKSMYNAIVTPTLQADSTLSIELSSEIPDVTIYYTFDNTDPDTYAPRYRSPLSVPKNATWLRCVTYRDGQPIGKVITLTIKQLFARAKAK